MSEHDEEDTALKPAFPVHPGLMLKTEVLAARGLKARALADAIHASEPTLNMVLNGRKPLTPSMALRIERAIGYPAELLGRMQLACDLASARREDADQLEAITPIAA